jgi:hypothetical protein
MNTESLSDLEHELTQGASADLPFEADEETPFPVEALPENMQRVVRELERVYKAPADLVAPLLLGCTSSCLGKGVRMRTQHPDPTYGLLYLLVCTIPGVNKSTILKWLQRPMLEWQKEAREKQRIRAETALASESKGNNPPAKKAIDAEIGKGVITLVVEHSSQEGLATSLTHNNEYLAVISSDCSGVVDDLKGAKNNGSFQGELLLKGYAGEAYDTNFKVAADEHLEEVRLSVTWAGTDQTLEGFVADPRIRGKGLLSRFLFAFIDEPVPRRDVERRQVSEEVTELWESLMKRLLRAYWRSAVPVEVQMDDDAVRLNVELDNLRIDHQHKLRHLSGLPERWAENALRIALVIHCMEYGEHAGSRPVDGSTTERAIRIIRWFIGREMAWMESFDEDDLLAEQLKAKVYKHLQENGPTTARDLGRKAGLKRNSRYLLDKWVEASELVTWDASKGGQPSPTYALKGEDRVPEEIRKGAELGEK